MKGQKIKSVFWATTGHALNTHSFQGRRLKEANNFEYFQLIIVNQKHGLWQSGHLSHQFL